MSIATTQNVEAGMSAVDEWLSLEDIAEELKLPLRTIYTRRSRGTGPKGYRIGRHVRVKRSDLAAWLEQQADREVADDAA